MSKCEICGAPAKRTMEAKTGNYPLCLDGSCWSIALRAIDVISRLESR